MAKVDASAFITREIPRPGIDIVVEAVAKVDLNPHDRVLTREELLAGVAGRDGVLCLLTDAIDAEVLDAAAGGGRGADTVRSGDYVCGDRAGVRDDCGAT